MRKSKLYPIKHLLRLTLTSFILTCATLTVYVSTPQITFAHDAALQNSDTLYHNISYEEELAEAVSVLTLGDISHVTSKLVLPHSYGIHVNICWSSNDESVIDLYGNVTTPTDTDKTVTLTARLTSTKLDTVETKEFVVHVPKASVEDVLMQDVKTTQEYIDYILNTGYILPDSKTLQIRSDIAWEITSGEAVIKDGKLIKTTKSAERQPIELEATLTFEGQKKVVTVKNITLLDEYAGYILSYFAGKEESKEMYLGYSYDGVHWMRLNHADAILAPKKGNRQIRDPFIMRKKDGSFAIFATNGWASPAISIWDSDNLVTFENERICQVSEKGGIASGFYAWAPECNYDPITDLYYIYWSDPKGNQGHGQTYFNTSADLKTMSSYDVLYTAPFSEIDASIKKYHGDYYMVYKDETGENDGSDGGKIIYCAKADSLEANTFYPYTGALSEVLAEGPFLFQNFKTGSWVAYYDYYDQHKFGMTTIEDITTDEWIYEGISKTMPWDEVRHGGVIPVTRNELDNILTAWAKENPELSSIVTPKSICTTTGSEVSSLKLPASVSVTLSDGMICDVPVTWDAKDISLKEEGTLQITGNLGTTATADHRQFAFTNKENLTTQITVTVKKSNSVMVFAAAGVIGIIGIILIFIIVKIHFRRKTSA